MAAVRSLESMPERNPLYKEEPWNSQGVRFVPVRNYLVFYTVNEKTDTVSVARIMYGARDISRQPEETTEWLYLKLSRKPQRAFCIRTGHNHPGMRDM